MRAGVSVTVIGKRKTRSPERRLYFDLALAWKTAGSPVTMVVHDCYAWMRNGKVDWTCQNLEVSQKLHATVSKLIASKGAWVSALQKPMVYETVDMGEEVFG